MEHRWREEANCLDMTTEVFFDRKLTPQARLICEPCPVRLQCLAFAMHSERESKQRAHGVYGGKTSREREALQKHFPSGVGIIEAFSEKAA